MALQDDLFPIDWSGYHLQEAKAPAPVIPPPPPIDFWIKSCYICGTPTHPQETLSPEDFVGNHSYRIKICLTCKHIHRLPIRTTTLGATNPNSVLDNNFK